MTWAGPRCVQELATFLGPQNRTQGRCDQQYCEAQARVRQGSARDGSQGERPQSLNPCLELTLKLVATHPPPGSLNNCLDKQLRGRVRQMEVREGV